MKKNTVLALLVALVFVLTACSPDTSGLLEETSAGHWGSSDELFGVAFDMKEPLNPITTKSKYNVEFAPLIFEGLITVRPNGEIEKTLCSDYSLSGNTLTFQMADRKFSDQTKVTASDVAYSLNLVLANSSSYYYKRLEAVDKVSAKSEDVLEITLKYPKSNFIYLLDIPVMKKDSDKSEYPIGSGPYVFKKDDGMGMLHLAYNENYPVKSSDYISRIELVDIPDPDALLYKFDAGDVDLLPVDLLDESQPGYKGKYNTVEYVSNDFVYLGVNCQREPLNNPKIRLAISSLIDRNEICTTSLFGRAESAFLPYRQDSELYDSDAVDIAMLSTEQSYAEIEAAGYKRDEAGLYKNASNRTLKFEILVPEDSYYKQQAAQGAAKELITHGIDASVTVLKWSEILSRISSRNFDMFVGEVRLTNDFDMNNLLIAPYPSSGLNASGITPEKLAVEIAKIKPDGSEYDKFAFAQAFMEDYPIIPLYFKKNALLIKLYNIKYITPASQNPYFGVYNWIVN